MKMIKYYSIIVLFNCIIAFQSCSGSHTISHRLITGEYSYVMTDSVGNPLVEGTLVLDTTGVGILSGNYKVTKKIVENFYGLRTMQGIYSGTYDKKVHTFYINMNPKLADANVMIKGKYTSSYLVGEWIYSTIAGIKNGGNFTAELIQ
jgi:hypothetical protein